MKLTEAMTPTGNPQSTYARSIGRQLGQEQEAGCFFYKTLSLPHAALKFLCGEKMKNSTLCSRPGIAPRNAAQTTMVINRTLEAGLIRKADPDHPRAGYVPH